VHLDQLPNAIVSALPLAGVYAVVGLGWVVLFRATRILNFATGQFVLFGAYLYYYFSERVGLPFPLSLVCAIGAMALMGAMLHILFMRRMVGQEGFAPVILTMGLAIVISNAVTLLFGPGTQSVSLPLAKTSVQFPGNIAITSGGFLIMGVAAVLAVGAILMIRFSRWGIQMRAAAEDPLHASQSGINVGTVFVGAWASASAVLGLMGVIYGFSTVVTPDMTSVGIRGLSPVIVGGMASIVGVVPGSIVVALIENVSVVYFGESVRDAAVMIVILAMLTVRPTGLFGGRLIGRV